MPAARTIVRTSVIAATLAGTAAATAAPASADPVAVGAGSTALTLTGPTTKALRGLGIRATAVGVAASRGATIAFPVTGGSIDPATAGGTLSHAGGLQLRKGGRRVRLTDLRVVVGKASTVSARLNGGRARVSLFTLVTSRAKITTVGSQTVVSRLRLHLTTPGAGALNATFRTHAFKGRQLLGTVRTAVIPEALALTGGNTALTLDAGTARTLAGLGLSVAPSPDATARPDGSIAFPISRGEVSSKTLAGQVEHTGGLTLSAGARSVTLRDFRIDLDGTPTLSADVGGQRVDVLKLDAKRAIVKLTPRQLVIANTKATLTGAAAAALNRAFGTGALREGLLLGTASVHSRIG